MGWSFVSVIVYIAIFFIVFWSEFVLLRGLDTDEVWNHLGTRTPYRFKYNSDEERITFPGCEEQKIWALIRHGTRYPSTKDIKHMKTTLVLLAQEIVNTHKNGKGKLKPKLLEQLKKWSTNLTEDDQKLLAYEGGDEMVLLAERLKKRFPHAIADKYNNDTFHFRYTATERAQKSAKHFTMGLFERQQVSEVWYPPAKNTEAVLRFYKHCDRWQKQVKKNESTYTEQKLYGESAEMAETLENISKRLGLDYRMNIENASLIYRVCGYDTAWTKNQISPWCYTLQPEDAEKLEYYYDLQHYWQDGYGHELTYRQACMSIKDMFDRFNDDGNTGRSFFLFAHSGTLLKTLAHLSLYKPGTPLTAGKRQTERTWKATNIDCFASNLIFVLYRCADSDYVLTLHQERPVVLPPCSSTLCPLRTLREAYANTINKCNLADLCSLAPLAT